MSIPYDYKVTCDVCGKELVRSQSKKRWDNMIVCKDDFELRHPNDFPPPLPKTEGRGVKDARPEPPIVQAYPVAAHPDNYKTNKVWGSTGDAIWGGLGDPSKWGNS